MSNISFEDKVRQLAERKQEADSFDWNAQREWWLNQLADLYAQVRGWLQPFVEKGHVTIAEAPVRLTEEHIGTYDTKALVLEFGTEAIVLHPMGTLIIGSRGRVDVYRRGRPGEPIMLILAGPKEKATWQVWPTRDPRKVTKVLDWPAFETVLNALL